MNCKRCRELQDKIARLEGVVQRYAHCDIDCDTQHPLHREPKYCSCGCVKALAVLNHGDGCMCDPCTIAKAALDGDTKPTQLSTSMEDSYQADNPPTAEEEGA